jgi:3'-5' exonuclease
MPVRPRVWVIDAEWVPDAALGRRLYSLDPAASEAAVFEEMWRRGGATDENPRPYLKTLLCRVVSLAVLRRTAEGGDPLLTLECLPREGQTEAPLLAQFMAAAGRERPLLVGFNSRHADLPIILQRAVAHGLAAPEFQRQDYMGWKGGNHVDVMAALGWGGRTTPSLHELASACGVPGKIDTAGGDVADLWLAGRLAEIAAYNALDVLSTYLVWLRLAHFEGQLDDREYADEQQAVERFLIAGAGEQPHYGRYLERWRSLRGA